MKSTSRKHNYRKEGIKPVWCPGCGDYGVLSAVERVFQEMQLPPEYISIISGIGCSGRFSHYFNTYNLHGTHGRVLPTATGVKAAMPELTILGVSGDGDGLSIGGGHISHAARRNLDITYLILDNNIYGLTKGQTSPTTPGGFQSNTSPYGVNEEIMEPVSVFLAYRVSFVARASSFEIPQLQRIIRAGIEHRGFSIIYIFSPCLTYPAMPWKKLKDKLTPLPEGFPTKERIEAIEYSFSTDPIYTGIFFRESKPTLEERFVSIEKQARKTRSLDSLHMTPKQVMESYL
ncbi:MAG: thiamine pyrophosphate-dependent enzyme [Spirochaetaceae bacterium]